MIKITKKEYLVRDIDFEITPENFESIKQKYISKVLAYLKTLEKKELFKKLAENISFEQFEEYLYYIVYGDLSCMKEYEIDKNFMFESEEGFIYESEEENHFSVINGLAEFIDKDLEKEWHRGELEKSHIEGNSWSIDKQYSTYPIQ